MSILTGTITNTLALIYLPAILFNYYPVTNTNCILFNQEYQTVNITIYQNTNNTDTTTSFNLWSYNNTTEHKFKLTISYRINSYCLHKEIIINSGDTYNLGKSGQFIFSRTIEHPPNSIKEYYIYLECLDVECLDNQT